MRKQKEKSNMKTKKNREKGVTLIALVITIVVLLILAGVSIAFLTGDNGIITQATAAREQNEIASVKEQAQLDIANWVADQLLNQGDTEVSSDDKVKEILTAAVDAGGEQYWDSFSETGIITPNGYEVPYSELYTGEIIAEQEPIEIGESYTASFADMNGDGTADGIIYADLAVGGSGSWGSNGWGNYSYEAQTGLKEYYVEEENYTESKFGNVSGRLISPIEGTTGADRFYVMALEDVTPGTRHSWYDAAYGKLDKLVGTSDNDFGAGDENTAYVMNKWDLGTAEGGWGSQNDNSTYDDMCGAIKEQVNAGWFVPSKSEWSAFGDMAVTKLDLTPRNHSSYGLNLWYCSSSQYSTNSAYRACFDDCSIVTNTVNGGLWVRLSTTF